MNVPLEDYNALLRHAEDQRKNKNFEDAYRLFQLALKQRTDDAWLWAHLGVVCRKLFRYADAQWCYDQAIRLKPGYAWAHAWRGQIRSMLGNYQGSVDDFDIAVRIEPSFAEKWGDIIGYQHHLYKHYQRAICAYEKGERANLPLATFFKADAISELHGQKAAEKAWDAALLAIETGIQSPHYRDFLKSCWLVMRGDLDEAVRLGCRAVLGHDRPLELLEYLVGEAAWMLWQKCRQDPRISALIDELMDSAHPGLIYWRKFLQDDIAVPETEPTDRD